MAALFCNAQLSTFWAHCANKDWSCAKLWKNAAEFKGLAEVKGVSGVVLHTTNSPDFPITIFP